MKKVSRKNYIATPAWVAKAEERLKEAQQKENERVLYCFDADSVQPVPALGATKAISERDEYRAICVYGDRFYKDKFVPMAELKKSYMTLEGSYHDINHWGTTFLDGNPNIEYIIGYNDNVKLDDRTKALSADIHILKTAKNYSVWKGFVDINKEIHRTPNVSVSFYSSKKKIFARDLPVSYSGYGLGKDDQIEYLYDIEFQALSTVFRGACSDKDGCGIGMGWNQPSSSNMSESELKQRIRCLQLQKRILELKGGK